MRSSETMQQHRTLNEEIQLKTRSHSHYRITFHFLSFLSHFAAVNYYNFTFVDY